MNKITFKLSLILLTIIMLSLNSCNKRIDFDFNMDNTFAWCIVPFDSEERSPNERMEMLIDVGFDKYAYDWREKHLDEMASEIKLAALAGIDIISVWLWVSEQPDSMGLLDSSNERILDIIRETGLQTTLWVGINENYFNGLGQKEAVQKGVEVIDYISQRANEIGCKLALYNHGGWYGEPQNQIEIIKALPKYEIGMIYNFHHAHHQLDDFPEFVKSMIPHLWAVNLNGMRKEGPKILNIGLGDYEKGMIKLLLDEGYEGPWGILGHIDTLDVKHVLEGNLDGLQLMQDF